MTSQKRITALVVISFFVALLLTACGPSADTPLPATTAATTAGSAATTAATSATTAATTTGGEIRIGMMGPFTGPSSTFGVAIKRGIQMAVDDINKAGGVNGRKIVLIERDDKATAQEGVTIIKDLIEKEKVVALIGTANSAVGVQQAPIVQQSKIPWAIPVTTGTKITQEPGSPSYIFRVSMVDQFQTQFVADYAAGKYKKIAVINDDTAYGTLGRDDLLKALSAKSIQPVIPAEGYKVGATADDMKPMVNKLKAAGPDIIINWGLGAEASNIKKAMKDLGVETPMIGSWGLSQPTFATIAQGLEAGTLVPQTFSVDSTNAKHQEFITRYKAEFKTDAVGFPSGLAQSYDAMRMLGEALKASNPADSLEVQRTKIRDAMEGIASYDGLIKKYDKPFGNQYHEAFTDKDFFMTVWKDGKLLRQN